ncbi:MAG: pyruvate, phosphate dikinase [Bdellovibrionota bacterium]
MSNKWVYFFGGDGKTNMTEGRGELKDLLGGKGANLAEMANLGLPVPPGFTLSTEICTHFYANNKTYPKDLDAEIKSNLKKLEDCMGLKFGCNEKPLLVSVRSGARASMPGMMDTVLNLGLNDQTTEALAKMFGNSRFALDCYRRFIQMYSDVVLGIHVSLFESLIEEQKDNAGVHFDADLKEEDLLRIIKKFKEVVLSEGQKFPQDVHEQLLGATGAVFNSWMSPRAIHYRKMEGIPESWGTAVSIQSMVYGNMGDDCATGVLFTRNPATGAAGIFGEFLPNAQGEDVVAGIRNPYPLNERQRKEGGGDSSLEQMMPVIYKQIEETCELLEKHYKDMQDIEFTIQKDRLFMLQTRKGKRTAQAAVKIAVDMVKENLIDKNEAVMRVDPYSIDQLLHPRLDPKKKGKPVAKGLPASPGAVCGEVVFQSNDAEKKKAQGKKVILVRHETSPEDIHGMDASVGILTALGGMTSHAAVVARGMGKSCIAGCAEIQIDYKKKQFTIGRGSDPIVVKEGELITIDANSGEVFLGEVPTLSSTLDADFGTLMEWSDAVRRMKIRTNADTPHDARTARNFGAEGIGLCRTEHMFFDPERIDAVRAMILAETADQRARALESIFPFQKNDFVQIFLEMKGLPVTIRLLDPPLHEFLPHSAKDIEILASKLGTSTERLMKKAEALKEVNPMLGHRGCRLGVSFPEIYLMQARAIGEAIVEAAKITKEAVQAEIMVPLISEKRELVLLRDKIAVEVSAILNQAGLADQMKIGTMIEIPRAALMSDEIAQVADFFSFGTNDLTQMTLGLSRDDSSRFLPEYIDKGIFPRDPFASIDVDGVGQLVRMSVAKARKVSPNFKTGVCGEHGGDPRSIYFFEDAGLDYVSCSPYRVPAARLAAAQAALGKRP